MAIVEDAATARANMPGKWHDNERFVWRARLGVINPSAGVTLDHEWARMLPRGVSYHVTRVPLDRGTIEALDRMVAASPDAAALLAASRVHALCYGCTLGSLYRGVAGERALIEQLHAASAMPVVSIAQAAVDALKSFGVRRLAVANPYTDAVNVLVRNYLEEQGFEVAAITTLSVADSWQISEIEPSEVIALGRRAVADALRPQGLLLSCGNMRTIEAIDPLEGEVDIPVVSSNQAMLWAALRTAGVDAPIEGPGRLLRELPELR